MAGYGDDAGFTTWLTENGYTLPVSAPSPAVLRQRGSAYIDGLYALRFPGYPTGGLAQERAWPRTDACVFGSEVAPTLIPNQVVQASYFAAYQEAGEPGSLSVVVTAAGQIKREKVGPIETEYAVSASADALIAATPILSAAEGLLRALFRRVEPAIFLV